jgi:hypothetical protein
MALFSNKKGIKQAKDAAGTMQLGGHMAVEAAEGNVARTQAIEESKMAVYGLLGKEGTYGPDAAGSAGIVDDDYYDTSGEGASQRNQDPSNSMKYFGYRDKYRPRDPVTGKALRDPITGKKLEKRSATKEDYLNTPREGILDPEKYADAVSKTSSFRTQSKQVAEAEQLLNQEGPAWDELHNSVTGAVNDQTALMLRDTLRQLKNDAAKGGSARRTAMSEFNIILAQERAQRTRVENTWKSNLALFDLVRKNADRVQTGTKNFMASLPHVNDAFRDSISRAAEMQMFAGQTLANVAQNAYAVKQSQQAVNFGTRFAEGLIIAAVSSIPYVGSSIGGAMKSAGAGGGYVGISPTPSGGMGVGKGPGYSGGALISGVDDEGGGGQMDTGQVTEGYNAVRGAAGTAWSTVSGAVSGWGWSDVRLKENLEHVGWQNGFNIYEFNFRGETQRLRGALAQEIIKTHPEAVAECDGYLMLNYDALGIEMKVV